ncbi:hypothetical protein K2P97_02815 [bacterium]|nr:hypothetical protein [bacterium]
MRKIILNFAKLTTVILFTSACANQPCKIEERTDIVMTGNEKVSSANKDMTQRVFIYKPDGSEQCGMGEKIELNEMKKELNKIEVFSQQSKHDGMMRIQVCGQPTGQCNVFEISIKDLEQALKLGYKKWTRD